MTDQTPTPPADRAEIMARALCEADAPTIGYERRLPGEGNIDAVSVWEDYLPMAARLIALLDPVSGVFPAAPSDGVDIDDVEKLANVIREVGKTTAHPLGLARGILSKYRLPATPKGDREALIEGLKWAMLGTEDGDLIDPDSEIPAGEMFRLASEYLAGLAVTPNPEATARVIAYLDEFERIHADDAYPKDHITAVNDRVLRVSDLRAALAAVTPNGEQAAPRDS